MTLQQKGHVKGFQVPSNTKTKRIAGRGAETRGEKQTKFYVVN